MPDYRPVPDEHRAAFQRAMRYAFQPHRGMADVESDLDSGPAKVADGRALYEGDEIVSTCAHYWFTTRVRGDWHEMAGLSAVATPPEHRRKGLVRRIIEGSLAEYRERGVHFAALWPFEYGFYRRFGWAMADRYAEIEVPVEELAFAADHREGSLRPVEADDWELLARVHRRHTDGVALAVDRSEAFWRHRIFESRETDPYVYVHERDGEARGYLVYRVEEGDGDEGRTLSVQEAGWSDEDAHLALLRFLFDHDSQVETVQLFGPPDPDLLDRLDDPRAAEVTLHPGAMFRVVDVAAGLSALDYPADVEGRLALAVSDPVVEENDGTFVLAVGDGEADCRRDDDADPDLRLDVNALSQVVAGYRPVARLATTATLDGDSAALDFLGDCFPEERVSLRERF